MSLVVPFVCAESTKNAQPHITPTTLTTDPLTQCMALGLSSAHDVPVELVPASVVSGDMLASALLEVTAPGTLALAVLSF